MKDHIYKTIEITGTSTRSIEDAINNALKRTGKSMHGLRWFQMTELRGDVEKTSVKHWQVTVKIGFALDA